VAATVPIAVLGNILRIMTLILLTYFFGDEVRQKMWSFQYTPASGVTDFIYTADTAAAFIACADAAPDGAHVFNLHGDARNVGDAVAIVEDEIGSVARGLISIDGPVIPMPPSLDDTALRLMVAGLPQTRLLLEPVAPG